MYVIGATLAPAHVTVSIPEGWAIATGLEPTSDPHTFFAPSAAILVDGPILSGKLSKWSFAVDGVPHQAVYWALPDATPFDTLTLVTRIQKLVQQASALFGRLPYREYLFLLQDGAWGGLEHYNSVTLGAQSAQLAKAPTGLLSEMAHEYIHTWNLMRIRPAEYADVHYKKQQLSRGLWWSEGLTMFYADLLSRRAWLPVVDSPRLHHLQALMRRYFNNAGSTRLSPEKVSLASYGPRGMLGNYIGSAHLQGELLGTVLDLIIRDATDGKRSIDDVMRRMMERFSAERGFTGKDIENIITKVCRCNVRPFFDDFVRGNKAIDFNKYLGLMGLRSKLSWTAALTAEGKPAPDIRVYSWQAPTGALHLGILDPASAWGKAGLHTGDVIKTVNGNPVATPREFFSIARNTQIGDRLPVEVQRPNGSMYRTTVVVSGYQQAVVEIAEIEGVTERQRVLRKQWTTGDE